MVRVSGVSVTYIVGSLTNGTTYYFQVAATNSVGAGTYSTEVSATPVTATLTVDLTSLTFVAGGEDAGIVHYEQHELDSDEQCWLADAKSSFGFR